MPNNIGPGEPRPNYLDRRTEPVGTVSYIERSTRNRVEARVGRVADRYVVLSIGDGTAGRAFMDPRPAIRLAWFLLEAAAGKAATHAARRAFDEAADW
jgi:hypothetical protein